MTDHDDHEVNHAHKRNRRDNEDVDFDCPICGGRIDEGDLFCHGCARGDDDEATDYDDPDTFGASARAADDELCATPDCSRTVPRHRELCLVCQDRLDGLTNESLPTGAWPNPDLRKHDLLALTVLQSLAERTGKGSFLGSVFTTSGLTFDVARFDDELSNQHRVILAEVARKMRGD